MFSNPLKEKMDPLSFCQLVPCSFVLFVNFWLAQSVVKLSPFFPVRCLRDEICSGHVWPLSLTVVLSCESSAHAGPNKQSPELRRPQTVRQALKTALLWPAVADFLLLIQCPSWSRKSPVVMIGTIVTTPVPAFTTRKVCDGFIITMTILDTILSSTRAPD